MNCVSCIAPVEETYDPGCEMGGEICRGCIFEMCGLPRLAHLDESNAGGFVIMCPILACRGDH